MPCQNMQYIKKAEGQIQELHNHFSRSNLVSFTKQDRKTTERWLHETFCGILSQISVISFGCKCLNISKPSVNKVFLSPMTRKHDV